MSKRQKWRVAEAPICKTYPDKMIAETEWRAAKSMTNAMAQTERSCSATEFQNIKHFLWSSLIKRRKGPTFASRAAMKMQRSGLFQSSRSANIPTQGPMPCFGRGCGNTPQDTISRLPDLDILLESLRGRPRKASIATVLFGTLSGTL